VLPHFIQGMYGNNVPQKRQALISHVSGSVYGQHHCQVEGIVSLLFPEWWEQLTWEYKVLRVYVLSLSLLCDILAQMQLQVCFVFIEYTDF
jgi:hypothetical protein